jgi:hypothetical protein
MSSQKRGKAERSNPPLDKLANAVSQPDDPFAFLNQSMNFGGVVTSDLSGLDAALGSFSSGDDGEEVNDEETGPYKDVKYNGKAEHDCKAEVSAVHQAFRDARKREAEQREEFADAGFYFCVAFETTAQKDEFIEKIGMGTAVDGTIMHISGFELAKRLGVKLDTPRIKFTVPRNDTSWFDEIGTFS